MSSLFGGKPPAPLPVVNPADTQNRLNSALTRRLQAGGTNADQVSNTVAPTGQARMPTLTGLS